MTGPVRLHLHLDLGCGSWRHKPNGRDELPGVDLRPPEGQPRLGAAKLVLRPIPFDTSTFDSVSAYDFFEPVPRLLVTADGRVTRLLFIELMNEVWRVLKPGGLNYAVTPVFPHPAALQDPTHVNIMTAVTHEHVVRPGRRAAMSFGNSRP